MQTKKVAGRRKAEVLLSLEDQEELERVLRAPTTSQRDALRAEIILMSAQGIPDSHVAKRLSIDPHTVRKWRRRFIANGMIGLLDAPRPKESLRLSDQKIAEIVKTTLETKPKGATHWSTRMLAKEAGVSQSMVSRVWRAFHLKPHRRTTFTLSTDPYFVDKVHDIVGLYMDPPDNAVVLCVDEKSQIQALERSQPLLPMVIGKPEQATPSYRRHGTTTLFAALDIATGKVIGQCHRKHRAVEFLKFLRRIDSEVPANLDVHIVLDNYTTHNTDAVLRWRCRNPRFHFHFTPTYSSWINQVERWFAVLTERQIKRGVHRSTQALEKAIREFLKIHNEDPKPFIWAKSAADILDSVERFCQRTLDLNNAQRKADSGH